MHEEWAGGIKLKPTSAYGVRLYQNGSSLVMHHDKVLLIIILSRIFNLQVFMSDTNPCNILYRSY